MRDVGRKTIPFFLLFLLVGCLRPVPSVLKPVSSDQGSTSTVDALPDAVVVVAPPPSAPIPPKKVIPKVKYTGMSE